MFDRIVYAVFCLLTLWAMAGGDSTNIVKHSYYYGLISLLLFGCIYFVKKFRIPDSSEFQKVMQGALIGLIVSVPFIILIVWNLKNNGSKAPYENFGIYHALIYALLVCPTWAILSRGLLQNDWGLGGVAFLDAVSFGFASQNFGTFLAVWAIGFVSSHVYKRFGIWAAIGSQSIFAFMLLMTLVLS